jgi:hypothetical protein
MIFDLLKYCLDRKDNMSNVVADIDWQQLYSFASKQAILGLFLMVLNDWEENTQMS